MSGGDQIATGASSENLKTVFSIVSDVYAALFYGIENACNSIAASTKDPIAAANALRAASVMNVYGNMISGVFSAATALSDPQQANRTEWWSSSRLLLETTASGLAGIGTGEGFGALALRFSGTQLGTQAAKIGLTFVPGGAPLVIAVTAGQIIGSNVGSDVAGYVADVSGATRNRVEK